MELKRAVITGLGAVSPIGIGISEINKSLLEGRSGIALNSEYKELYPFSEIVGNSNVLVMPSQHSAAISYKMIKSMSRAKVIGPLLIGLGLPIEIAPLRSSTSDIINLASIAAYSADVIDYKKN